jgi:Mtd second domain
MGNSILFNTAGSIALAINYEMMGPYTEKFLSREGNTSVRVNSEVFIRVGDAVLCIEADVDLTPSDLDTGSSFDASDTYYIYGCQPLDGTGTPVFKISKNATYPAGGWDADTSRKIGGFDTDGDGYVNVNTLWDLRTNDVTTSTYTDADARGAINDIFGSDGKADDTIDLDGNTIDNPLDPTAGTHVGDRDYNDTRYLRQATVVSQADAEAGTSTTAKAWTAQRVSQAIAALKDIAGTIFASSAKTTPADADTVGITDSAASNALKKVTWANIKATLKTYFDTLYSAAGAIFGSTGGTDNRVLRADGTGGKTAQASAVAIDDSGNVTGVADLTASGSVSAATLAVDSEPMTPVRGTYTPTLTCSTSGSYVLNTSYDTLAITKIGTDVHVFGSIAISSESTPLVGDLRLSLPYTVADLAESSDQSTGFCEIINHGGTIANPRLSPVPVAAYGIIYSFADDGTLTTLDKDNVDDDFAMYVDIWFRATE